MVERDIGDIIAEKIIDFNLLVNKNKIKVERDKAKVNLRKLRSEKWKIRLNNNFILSLNRPKIIK